MSSCKAILPVIRSLGTGMELDELLALALRTAVELTRAERGCLMLVSPGDQLEPLLSVRSAVNLEPALLESEGFAASRTAIRQAIAAGEAVTTHDALNSPELSLAESVRKLKLRSIVAVPLRIKSGVIGVLYADAQSAGAFGEEHLDTLEALASLAAIALENARLQLA